MKQEPERERAGLCFDCRHARRLTSDRGSVFYQCLLARTDPRFESYPRLPMVQCEGFERGSEAPEKKSPEPRGSA